MPKTTLLLTLIAVLALPALVPAQADARYKTRIGIGDQQTAMFDNVHFRALKVKRVRYFVPWNAMRNAEQRAAAEQYVAAARRNRVSVFMHISSDNLVRKKARLPKLRTYTREVKRLIRHFRKRGVREWGSRNEANHDSQAYVEEPEARRAGVQDRPPRVQGLHGPRPRRARPGTVSTRYMARFYRALGSYRRFAGTVGSTTTPTSTAGAPASRARSCGRPSATTAARSSG